MIISNKRRFAFIHNPKAAGTTVRFALEKFDSYNGKFWRNSCEQLGRYHDMAHLSAASLARFFPREYAKVQEYFSFGYVRHPISRFFSGFNETHKQLWMQLSQNREFLNEYKKVLVAYTKRQLQCSHPEGFFTHVKPQKSIYYFEGNCIANLVLKIEEAQEGNLQLIEGVGAEVHEIVSKAFSTPPKNQKGMYFQPEQILESAMLNDLVDYYSEDFTLFGYSFLKY